MEINCPLHLFFIERISHLVCRIADWPEETYGHSIYSLCVRWAELRMYIERLRLHIVEYVHHAIFIQLPSQRGYTIPCRGGYTFQHHLNGPSPPSIPKLHLKTRYFSHFYFLEQRILQNNSSATIHNLSTIAGSSSVRHELNLSL